MIVSSLDDVWIYDLGSTHGVFVDGKKDRPKGLSRRRARREIGSGIDDMSKTGPSRVKVA